MNRRTALKQMALGLGASLTQLAHGQRPDKGLAGERAVVNGNREFATDLYGQLRDNRGNLFFSPYSISTALAMTYAGALGQTADEMAKALHFTLDRSHLSAAFATLAANTKSLGKKSGCELFLGNALWGHHGYHFLSDFLNQVRKNFDASVNEVDFVGHAEEARHTINTWVEKQTKEKIKDLLPSGVLTPDTRLVLPNAIYFKSTWQSPFNQKTTREEAFTLAPQEKIQVPMMHRSADFGYVDGGSFDALDLPYAGKELSMTIFLPKKVDGLAEFEKTVTSGKLVEWLSQLKSSRVDVALPKFKMMVACNLKQALSRMGMASAFGRGADFSGMTGSRDLFLSEVVHKAQVDVQEEGTEAAAATGVVMERLSLSPSVRTFRADHPFVFVIRDRRLNSILFMGRLIDPRG